MGYDGSGLDEEHKRDRKHSKLKKLVPQVGVCTELTRQALREYDGHSSLMERRLVPPNLAEISTSEPAQIRQLGPSGLAT